jgi:hypothetical protein
MRDNVMDYPDRMQQEIDMAKARYTQANGDDAFHAQMAAEHIAKVQRLSQYALHQAVTEAHEAGLSWRSIAPAAQMYFQTLHRQWSKGKRLILSD